MTLAEAVIATAEQCGTRLSENAAELVIQDLEAYPQEVVFAALAKCRRELKGRLTVAEILCRIDDGRPGPDEAFGMLAWDEETTVVLTREMQEAQGAACHLWHAGDRSGARLAFREAYIRLVNAAREARRPVSWEVSLGWDKAARRGPIEAAMRLGRIEPERALRLLPAEETRRREKGGSGGLTRFGQ